MSKFVQALESRTLLSASGSAIVADEVRLVGDARAIRSDVHHFSALLKTDSHQIQADLRGLPKTAGNRALVATLRTDLRKGTATLQKDVSAIIRTGSADARKALGDGMALFLNPTNVSAIARLAGDITRLESGVAAPLAALLTDAAAFQANLSGDLTALSAANPTNDTLQSHVQTASADTASALATAHNDVNTVQTDVTALLRDLT